VLALLGHGPLSKRHSTESSQKECQSRAQGEAKPTAGLDHRLAIMSGAEGRGGGGGTPSLTGGKRTGCSERMNKGGGNKNMKLSVQLK